MTMRATRWAALAAVGLAVAAQPLAAQVVRGRVIENRSGDPVAFATVTVLDPEGNPAAYGQSNGVGEFAVRLAGPGRFVIRAERIGYRSASSALSDVDEGDEVYRVLNLARGEARAESGDGLGGIGFLPRGGVLGPGPMGTTATDTRPAPSSSPAPDASPAPAADGTRAVAPAPRPAPAVKPRAENDRRRAPRGTRPRGTTRLPQAGRP
jgi:hypothetical protein